MMSNKRHAGDVDKKVAYFFGFVLLSLTAVSIWLMAFVPPAPTQETEHEIPNDIIQKNN
jgi:hypothetical protein